MAFRKQIKLTDEQLARDAETTPAFVRAVDARLRQVYPNYTVGTWVEFARRGRVQWSVVVVSGAARGFRVFFRLPAKNRTAAKLKVVPYSRIFGFLVGISAAIALIFGVAMKMRGTGALGMSFLIMFLPLLLISWVLAGAIARAMGKALSEEELQKIGQHVLEALGPARG